MSISEHKEINYTFKLLSAFTMILILVGHIDNGAAGFSGPYDLFKPYAYHVAVFVFISGYFYSTRYEDNVLPYFGKKTLRLMVPLYLISFLYGCFWMVVKPALGLQMGEPLTLYNVFLAPVTTGHQYAINLAMWFIAPLYCAEIANVLIRMGLGLIWHGESVVKETFLLVLYLGFGAVAILRGGTEGLVPGWTALACRTLFFLACLGMGRYYRAVLERHDTLGNTAYFSIVILAQMIVIIALKGIYVYQPSWCVFPNGILGTYVVTILGIAFLLRVCRVLEPVMGHNRIVLAIADNTFSIMCHHLLGFFLLNCLFAFGASYLGLFGDFNYQAFSLYFTYAFAPYGCPQLAVIYLVAGVGVSLLIHRGWLYLKRFVGRWLPALPQTTR